jgi:alkylhydroperoxidase family enzyme
MALKVGVTAADVAAIRGGGFPADPKLAALARLARQLVARHGHVDHGELEAFVAAGYTHRQVLEAVTGIGVSTMAALVGNLAGTPVEAALQANAWSGNQG